MLRDWKFAIQIDAQSGQAVYLQIADAVIQDIRSGRLKSGDALPGSRSLAQLLKVNRNTVVEALNVLLMEGWLVSKERKGTFVANALPGCTSERISGPGAVVEGVSTPHFRIVLNDGYPDSKMAPMTELARAYRQVFNQKARWQMMGYGSPLGELEFRKALVQMLNHQRAMQADEDNICITRGSQMAMYLTAQCLLAKGDYVMVEHPGYKPAWAAFESAGAKLLPVSVDRDGLMTDDVIRHLKKYKNIKAIYVTPHHQYPTTVTLSLQRRMELIKLSNAYHFTVIEDDYDNEFHFGYRPVLPLCSFKELEHYVYLGTLSKVVAPALRIGYMTSSDRTLIKKVADLRKVIDVQGDNIMEHAVLQLIKDGTIKRHIKKATLYYKAKRDFTAALLKKYLEGKAEFAIPDGGLAFWIVPEAKVDWEKLSCKLEAQGIKIIRPEAYSYRQPVNGVRLGYGSLSESELEEAIVALGKWLEGE